MANTTIADRIAGENIPAFKVVYFHDNGKIYMADKTNMNILESRLGMITASVLEGNTIDVVIQGEIENSNWNLTINESYFLDTNGNITITPAGSGEIFIKIGTALSTTELMFDPGPAIKRA